MRRKITENRIFGRVIAVLMLCALLAVSVPFSVFAGQFTSTVNLLDVRKNASGDGFTWANKTKTLTLTDFTVNTSDRYGLRIPHGATVVLVGTNTINASYAALEVQGDVYFRGEGTLILNGGEIGFINSTNMDDKKVIFESGNYVITAGENGIVSEYATWSQTGGKIEINAAKNAAYGRDLRLMGGSFKANAPVHATNKLTVNHTSLDITAASAALVADKTLSVNNVKLSSGGTKLTEYKGENSILTSPMAKKQTTSRLFELIGNKNVPVFVDYVIFAVAIGAVVAIIVVPKVLKKKKLREALAKYEAEEKARAEEKKRGAK